MRKQQYGRIVSITSAMANYVYEGLGAYSAAKAGLEGLMRTVALEEEKHGILVNMFDPGNLKTEQNPYGEGDPATVVDGIVKMATMPKDGINLGIYIEAYIEQNLDVHLLKAYLVYPFECPEKRWKVYSHHRRYNKMARRHYPHEEEFQPIPHVLNKKESDLYSM